MSSAGTCAIHGPQDAWDFVCLGVGDALKEEKAVGFVWGVYSDGGRWAICSHCDAEIEKGNNRPHRAVPLCRTCFDEAWQLNGKPEKFQ